MKKIEEIPADQTVVGIDVAKEKFDVFIDAEKQERMGFLNQGSGIRRLVEQMKRVNPAVIVMEATGGYENAAAIAFAEAGLPFAIVFPPRVRQFANALGMNAKTDEIDAYVIAQFGRKAGIRPIPFATTELRELSAAISRRKQLQKMLYSEQNRLETADLSAHPSLKKHIGFLQNELQDLQKEIRHRIKESEPLKKADEMLRSVPGVGPVLSSTLITDLPELGYLSPKKIAALVGLAPHPRDTGKSNKKRYCRGGRLPLRNVLYMATLSAVRYNPLIKAFYENLCRSGKLKKVALIACARKLLVVLNAMTRNATHWQLEHLDC